MRVEQRIQAVDLNDLCVSDLLRPPTSDNEQANKRAALDRYVMTVKRCLTEYEQAQRFFRTPLPGVPPPLVIDEFALVDREWERRLTIQRFRHALKTGAITGMPFHLMGAPPALTASRRGTASVSTDMTLHRFVGNRYGATHATANQWDLSERGSEQANAPPWTAT
jgi:hypothetical protein